ncbi:hypothetical protein UA08_02361 [Talaromyces atroroseus]|uniref:DNA replication checkpoint mediator MRC1 domain-containing protein n=1 Tax=Talaromyces atroroseus TaxID=1441469 RepID=A0A225ARI7_TALAT|nr:hypothetical protein UA08_02361 [Talaromyces atroroseus]OKL62113.1 hypothetical protein UA08_02361 [Talaromyces atroroseus]
MSAPSTPRSTRLEPTAGSPAQMLTPGQKIKAMLAAFDDDSEPENTTSVAHRPMLSKPTFDFSKNKTAPTVEPEDDDEDEDDVIFAPRGRMAARMQGHDENGKASRPSPVQNPETAYERVARRLHAPSADAAPVADEDQSSEDDDVPSAILSRRHLLQKKERGPGVSSEKNESSRERSESPLFMEQDNNSESEVENDEPITETENSRLRALVEKKRKERKEKERIESEKKAARAEKAEQFNSDIMASEDSEEDIGSARKMTQQSRPTRKASKKALEEMNRETQRISRNMQLTHEARTKRKITMDSFLDQFKNYGQRADTSAQTTNITNSSKSSIASSSTISSDGEGIKEKGTPATSPVRVSLNDQSNKAQNAVASSEEEGPYLPTMEELQSQIASSRQATAISGPNATTANARPQILNRPTVNVRLSRQDVARYQQEASDDELEVVTSPGKCRQLSIFENVRSKNSHESRSALTQKMLARVSSPTRRTKSINHAELSASLLWKAREQARQERQEKIEELRARGVYIETAEEREAMEGEVEDLVEKARKDAEEIARQEKAAREKKSGVVESESDEEDYDYSGSEEEEDEEDEVGESDTEGEDSEEEEEEEASHHKLDELIHNEADETAESEDEEIEIEMQEDEEDVARGVRRKRRTRVLSDDEDEQDEVNGKEPATSLQEIKTPARSVALSSGSAQRPHFPDVAETSSFTMGLTQAFAGTIGENQSDGEDSFSAIQSLPDPGLSNFQGMVIDSQVMVKDSQEQRRESIDLLASYTQSNARVSESPAPNWSQASQFPEPTQDAGFTLTPFDQSKRFIDPPASTIDTVILPERDIASPTMHRKNRLQRGRPAQLSDDEDGDFEIKASAFDVMKKSGKRKSKSAVPFDKMNSKAKEHVDEAAEESEDEYAGLGGASDDENGNEDEFDREMINDDSNEVVDEKELAALNANHQRAVDEKEVSRIMKDITTGALRRRRGADNDFDLDDSDDERAARRREKQREFAKMRKALLADEKVNEIAKNPKKEAFFKTLEDRDDDDMDFEFQSAADSQEVSSQGIQGETLPAAHDSGNTSHKRKRPLQPAPEDVNNRPPPHLRRTAASVSRKPSSLSEIRETLSFLTATPEYDSFHEDASIEQDIVYDTDKGASDDDDSTTEPEKRMSAEGFAIPPNPRRTRGRVVDRLALKRAASSNSASANTKSAFMTGLDSLSHVGFRPPALFRRSTTSSSSTSSDTSFSTTRTQKPAAGARPAVSTTKGAVNYYTAARERERERELRLGDRLGKSAATAALLKQKALSSGLMALNKNQWE